MGTERKRKVSLFDVVDDTAAKMVKSNGGAVGNSLINRWNGKPYSQRYYEILEKRKTLPVWHQKEEFLQVLKDNQTLILVGETGSGKTTQVCFYYIQTLSVATALPRCYFILKLITPLLCCFFPLYLIRVFRFPSCWKIIH